MPDKPPNPSATILPLHKRKETAPPPDTPEEIVRQAHALTVAFMSIKGAQARAEVLKLVIEYVKREGGKP